MNKRRLFYSLSIMLLLIVAVVGWFATEYLANRARQEIIGECQTAVLTLSTYITSTLNTFEGAVKSLAGSPSIAPALLSKGTQGVERANRLLDRYNSALRATVSYLMDADGMTVASSNRNDPDSFVGKSYGFRPYFQEAVKGQTGRYFALGITSGKRGFYASHPVQNRLGKVIGVVTMKKDLDDMTIFFSRFPFCFLINPDGIVFLSSSPAMDLKNLWPLDKEVRDALIASRQFGDKLDETGFLQKEISDGAEITLEGKDYFVSRSVVNTDRWSIVHLTPTNRIMIYRWIGILTTISVCLLILIFSRIIYVADRSKEAIRQSEESKRLLLHAAGEGIFGVDATGQATFVNPSALRMLGFTEEEMLGQKVHALIHHSHKDGSSYPLEDCPMYGSYTKAANSHVADELLWRKDGSSFPADYSSMPIISDNEVVGAVVTFRDITERKRVEQEMAVIAEIGRIIGSTMDIDEVYERFAETVRKIIPFDRIVVNIIDVEMNTVTNVYMAGHGITDRKVGVCYPLQGSGNFEMVRTKSSLLIQTENFDEYKDRFSMLLSTFQAGFRSIMNIPLFLKGEIVGGLLLRSLKPYAYTDHDVRLAERVGNQIAGAIANTQLFNDLSKTEKSLRESEGRFRGLVEQAAVGVAEVDMSTGRFITVNRRLCEMLGRTEEELLAATFQAITHPEDAHLHEEKTALLAAGKIGHYNLEKRYLRKDGEIVWVNLSTSPLWKPGEKPGHNMIVVEDITERRRMEETLRKSDEEQRLLIETLPLAVFVETHGKISYVNPAFLTLLKASSPNEVIGIRLIEFVSPELYDTIEKRRRIMTEEKCVLPPLEQNVRCMDGTFITVVSTPIPFIFQGQPAILTALYDITERKRSEIELGKTYKLLQIHAKAIEDLQAKLKEQAFHDPLTGLPNRKLFSDRLDLALAQSKRNQKKVGIAMLDLDNFKGVNDTLGHDVGDLLLKATADRLNGVLRKGDTVARFGGDEFVLILPELGATKDAIQVAQKVVDIFLKPFPIDTHQLVVTTSIGIALYPNDGTDEVTLLKNADIAMYQAKQAGRARYRIYQKA